MKIRRATAADESVLRELIAEFNAEIPEPDDVGPEGWEDEWQEISRSLAGGCQRESAGQPGGQAGRISSGVSCRLAVSCASRGRSPGDSWRYIALHLGRGADDARSAQAHIPVRR